MLSPFLLVCTLASPSSTGGIATAHADEILWDRSDVAKSSLFLPQRLAEFHYESEEIGAHYSLSSVVVSKSNWRVNKITAWFRHNTASSPEQGWKTLKKDRLNIVPVNSRP